MGRALDDLATALTAGLLPRSGTVADDAAWRLTAGRAHDFPEMTGANHAPPLDDTPPTGETPR